MRNLGLLLFIMVVACSRSRQEQAEQSQSTGDNSFNLSVSLNELQGEWQQLTEQEGGSYIIFQPCDADNRMIQITGDTLMIGWGQDASFALIKSFYVDDAGRLVLSVHDLDENARRTYYMQWDGDLDPLTTWFLFGLEEPPMLMAHESILSQFMVVQQPCRECWDDCEE